jgi:hypothetical protein
VSAERPAKRSTVLRDLALLYGIPFVLAVILIGVFWRPFDRYAPEPPLTVFDVAPGTWDWESKGAWCAKFPHTIAFSPDHAVMYLRYAHLAADTAGAGPHEYVYDIQSSTKNSVRGLIRGEKRMTPAGVPVVWDLVLDSDHEYVWHRTDWSFWETTGKNVRCTWLDSLKQQTPAP